MKITIKNIARIGGLLYLIIIVAGIFSETFVRNNLVVYGDATATAANIMADPFLWRIGITSDLIMHLCDIPLILVFYILFKPVNKNLALLAVLFNLIQTAVLVANKLNLLLPLFLLGNAEYFKNFEPAQLHALAYIPIKMHGYGLGAGLLFFGFECLILGYLIFKSGFLPKFLGILMQIAGLSYLLSSFSLFLAPDFANMIFPAVLVPAFIGELSLCLWMIIKGVHVSQWQNLVPGNA